MVKWRSTLGFANILLTNPQQTVPYGPRLLEREQRALQSRWMHR
jgi:hypothetical protein